MRILPLHYFLIVHALLLSVAGVERQLWYHLSFTTNLYIPWSGDWEGCLFHLWSIATEEQFYLIWPAAILLLRPSTRKRIVIYGIVAAVLYRFITEFAGEGAHFHARYLPIAQLDCFFLGSALADLYTSYAETQPDMVRRWVRSCVAWGCYSMLIGSLSYLLGLTPYFSDGSFTLLSLRLWFAALIGSIAMRPPNPAKGFFYLILIYLGKRSYGIYMYHTMVLYFILRSDGGFGGAQPLLTCAIVFSITTCCAIVSWRYIESPFNQLKSRFPIRGYS